MFKSVRLFFLTASIGLILLNISHSQEQNSLSRESNGNNATGWYYTGDAIPGNPENGINNLKRVYKFIQIYRSRHEGNYQVKRGMVSNDMLNNPQAYGYNNPQEVVAALANPDNQYNDWSFIRKDPLRKGGAALLATRPDGSPLGGVKLPGTFDVLAQISTYYHRNDADRRAGRSKPNPTGFYLLLDDKGEVARIPYDRVFFVYRAGASGSTEITTTTVFPGQAGIPFNCLSYEENWATYWPPQQPPIGYPIPEGSDIPVPDNGAYEGIIQLSRFLYKEIEREAVWDIMGRSKKEFTMPEVEAGAQKLGLSLQFRKLSLEDLQEFNAPAIFVTSDDKRIVTLSNFDDNQAIVIDRGMTRIVSREILARKYSGAALLPQATQVAARIAVEDPIRVLTLQSTGEEMQQQVVITNRGQQALTLQIEWPIPGVTKAELSADTVAPGQSATLSLSMQWREVLKGNTQNVFVFLRTNDPMRARLQLGFQLRAPQSAAP